MKKQKQLYRGAFDFQKRPRVIYRWATSEKAAWSKMVRFFAGDLMVPVWTVRDKFPFDGDRTNFQITIEPHRRASDDKKNP